MKLLILVDYDIVLHRTVFSCNNHPYPLSDEEKLNGLAFAHRLLLDKIKSISDSFKCSKPKILYVLSGTGNFRKDLYPAYKAHRKQKPDCFDLFKDRVESTLNNLVLSFGQEADDEIGIYSAYYQAKGYEIVIMSIDSDLKMISCHHYNLNKDTIEFVDKETAIKNFYKKLLTGDVADNVPGVKRIGKIKAMKVDSMTILQAWEHVKQLYSGQNNQLPLELVAQLLWVRRKPFEYFKIDEHDKDILVYSDECAKLKE